MSWSEVGVAEDPVRGDAAAFTAAAVRWKAVHESATMVQSEFRGIVSGHVMVGFEGRAAEQFSKVVGEIQYVLDDLPLVSEKFRSALDDHRIKLEALRQEADHALARAKVAKAECATSSAAHASCVARTASLQKQIDQLRAAPEPDETQVLNVDRLLQSATQERNRRFHATSALEAQLASEVKKWGELRSREDGINRETAARLESIDLLRLRDPNWIKQQLDAFGGFMGELVTDLWKSGAALLRGDMDAALFHLRDALDKLLTILSVVSLILDVVAIVLVMTGIGLPLAAALFAVSRGLRLATLVIAAVNMRAGIALVASGSRHPETGERLGIVDLAFDGLQVGLAALGARGAKTISMQGPVKYNVGRAFVKDQIGISFKRGYEVAWKQTSRNVLRITLKGSDFYGDVFSGYQGGDSSVLEATESFAREQGHDGGTWQGTSPEKARNDAIQQGISDIRAGQPGIVTPVMTNVVSF